LYELVRRASGISCLKTGKHGPWPQIVIKCRLNLSNLKSIRIKGRNYKWIACIVIKQPENKVAGASKVIVIGW
jgi:hypothetical protein